MHTLQTNLITECLDLLAGFELLTAQEQSEITNVIIDTLGSYPKPQKKHDPVPAPTHLIGAYLCISNARNACKLFLFGFDEQNKVACIAFHNLGKALGLLLHG